MDNYILSWKGYEIDVRDIRLHDYIMYVDTKGDLCIVNKTTFNMMSLSKMIDKEKGDWFLLKTKDSTSTFCDFNFFISQLIGFNN